MLMMTVVFCGRVKNVSNKIENSIIRKMYSKEKGQNINDDVSKIRFYLWNSVLLIYYYRKML